MKKNGLTVGVLIACLIMVGMFSVQAESFVKAIGLDKVKRKAVLCKQLGLYPVFEYKKNRKSRLYVTPFAPVTAQAIANAANKTSTTAVSSLKKATTVKDSTVDIQVKHIEKTVKLADGNYATALWETITNNGKLYNVTDTAYTGATKIEITSNGLTYTTTLDQGTDKSKFGTDSGKCIIEDQYWPGVGTKGPDGKIKNDVKVTIVWKPGYVKAKFTLRGPRNLPFVSRNTTTADPVNNQDGTIWIWTDYSVAITNNDITETWVFGGDWSTGKKKTKVQKKPSLITGNLAYYVLTNWNTKLKKAVLTKQ